MQRFFLLLLVLISALFVPVGARSQPVDSPTDPPSAATLDGAQIGERIDGWVIRDTEWGPMIAHSGSNQIFSADFVWLPQRELFLYIQGNTSMVPARGQRDRLLAAAFDPEFPMPPLVEADENARPEVAAERVGTYRLGEGSLEVTADDTRLLAKLWVRDRQS